MWHAKRVSRISGAWIGLALLRQNVAAEVIRVPADAPTIQAAIDLARDGDRVLVDPGTYRGDGNRDIEFRGKHIEVRCDDDEGGLCQIVCDGRVGELHRGFWFHQFETRDSILDGFEIAFGGVETPGQPAHGGGILCENASPTIRNCQIRSNYVGFDNAAGLGGGVYSTGGHPLLENCVISNNFADGPQSATPEGGGIYADLLTLKNCIIAGNHASVGAGVRMSGGLIVNCRFDSNVAGEHEAPAAGAGLFADEATVLNSVFIANRLVGAEQLGAAIALGGGTIVNCTFTRHVIAAAGAVAWLCGSSTPAAILNSILWDSGPEIMINPGADALVSHCIVRGGFPGVGNLAVDPLLLNSTGPDRIGGTIDDLVGLAEGSPAVDAGNNAFVPPDMLDLDHDGDREETTPVDASRSPRLVDDPLVPDSGSREPGDLRPVVDIGAVEFYVCLGDLDESGAVDIADLERLLSRFGMPAGATHLHGDLDRDQDVDLQDLATMLARLGQVCESSAQNSHRWAHQNEPR